MFRDRFDIARQLIIEKHFQAARELLKTIDDPKAQQWLAKLEQVQPEDRRHSHTRNYVLVGGLSGLLCLLLGIAIGFALFAQEEASPQFAATELTHTPASSGTVAPTRSPTPARSRTAVPTRTQYPTPTAGITSTPDCWKHEWWQQAKPVVVRFLDTAEVAGATSRIALSPILLELRQIYREFDYMEYPACVSDIRNSIRRAMDTGIDGMQAFLAERDATAGVTLDQASQYFKEAHDALFDAGLIPDLRMGNMNHWVW